MKIFHYSSFRYSISKIVVFIYTSHMYLLQKDEKIMLNLTSGLHPARAAKALTELEQSIVLIDLT